MGDGCVHCFCVFFFCGSSEGADFKTDVSFSVESWITYDDNVFLTANESDEADLTDMERYQPEESDTFTKFLGDFKLNYSLEESDKKIFSGYLGYSYSGNYFFDETSEDNYQNKLNGEFKLLPEEIFSMRFFAGTPGITGKEMQVMGWVNSRGYWLGTEGIFTPGPNDQFSLLYEYGFKDYEKPPEFRPISFNDYEWQKAKAKYTKKFNRNLFTDIFFSYRWRDYDQDARDGRGMIQRGEDRIDRFPEAGIQVTNALTDKTALRLGYQYADNRSNRCLL